MKITEDTHEEALSRLCFVCGEIITATQQYDVENHLDFLRIGLSSPGISPTPGATPLHFCRKCYAVLRSFVDGKNVQTSRKLLNWPLCGPDCSTCAHITKRKSTKGRHKKVNV